MASVVLMDADKFKKAIRSLPDDPAEGVEFQAFWATKKNDKNTYVGLYVGAAMTTEYKKDKRDSFDKVVKFHGELHRSSKLPDRRLVLKSTAQARFSSPSARTRSKNAGSRS